MIETAFRSVNEASNGLLGRQRLVVAGLKGVLFLVGVMLAELFHCLDLRTGVLDIVVNVNVIMRLYPSGALPFLDLVKAFYDVKARGLVQ